MGSVQLSLSPIARPATPKVVIVKTAANHGVAGCCRSGVVFSMRREPSPLISPVGDSDAPIDGVPFEGEAGVTP